MVIAESKTIKIQESKTCKECGDKLDETGTCPGCGYEEGSLDESSEEDDKPLTEEDDENY